jgi:hypothetical protein
LARGELHVCAWVLRYVLSVYWVGECHECIAWN